MPRDQGPEKTQELQDLRDWCIAVVRFICDLSTATELYTQFEEAIENAHQRRDLRGLKMVSNDLTQWASDLPPEEQDRLERQLTDRFGWGLAKERHDAARRVASILRRGQIDSEEQYRLLVEHADEIHADESKTDEMQQINSLLASYEAD